MTTKNELSILIDGVSQLRDLLRDKPPGWDLKALYLATQLNYGNVETFVESTLPMLEHRIRELNRIANLTAKG